MTSAAQLVANRANARRSTGPRTVVGKAISSQNANRHGFTGRLLVGRSTGPSQMTQKTCRRSCTRSWRSWRPGRLRNARRR